VGVDGPRILQEEHSFPKARGGAFLMPPNHNGMEVSGVGILLQKPILASLLSPENLLTLKDLHKGA
jgi:hypothetical protein